VSLQRAFWSVCLLAFGSVALLVQASEAEETAVAADGLEPAWSVQGMWSGVAGNERKGTIYALSLFGGCVELDSAGKVLREISVAPGGSRLLRLARFRRHEKPALLTFDVWAGDLRALDSDGKELWSYPEATGIDDVWAADLDGDGTDEVIVGYNGGTGLHVLNGEGQLQWKSTAIGNVWHVCAGNVWGEETSQVVTTSAAGGVHVFGSDGKERVDLSAGCYAFMVRVGRISKEDNAATIFVAGSPLDVASTQREAVVAALSGDGRTNWSLRLPAGGVASAASASLAPTRPWLAVGMRNGDVHVVDAKAGKLIASTGGQSAQAEVAWASPEDKGAPLLLVATGMKLNAFPVTQAE